MTPGPGPPTPGPGSNSRCEGGRLNASSPPKQVSVPADSAATRLKAIELILMTNPLC